MVDTTGSPAIDPLFASTAITDEAGQEDWGYCWTSTTHMNGSKPGRSGAYVCFGRCMGYMNGQWMDVHGAGARRACAGRGTELVRARRAARRCWWAR